MTFRPSLLCTINLLTSATDWSSPSSQPVRFGALSHCLVPSFTPKTPIPHPKKPSCPAVPSSSQFYDPFAGREVFFAAIPVPSLNHSRVLYGFVLHFTLGRPRVGICDASSVLAGFSEGDPIDCMFGVLSRSCPAYVPGTSEHLASWAWIWSSWNLALFFMKNLDDMIYTLLGHPIVSLGHADVCCS